MKTFVIYNKKANNNQGAKGAFKIKDIWVHKDLIYKELNEFSTYRELFDSLDPDDEVVICGGDGTLNYLVNDLDCAAVQNPIFYFPTGSGNDFWHDLGKSAENGPAQINPYLVKLPTVHVNGISRKFINGVGYGIDGYCCEVSDKQRAAGGNKPINYTSIAIKGLLFHYQPTRASVTVDGVTHTFEKVWLAPTMNGRFYGGGMMPTPGQNRLNHARTVTTMLMHSRGKLLTLAAFPAIFKGEHVHKTDIVSVFTGRHVRVSFDRPVPLQIDGETILSVSTYEVETAQP
ncbi:MAG: diacylglycerol kinase family protein [Ruminococcus sp.]|nr:diacylglycerol kinase family protein [Ruminococcus sp.]